MKVSVCIAATRAASIGAAVASIVRQTYQDWELIVVAQGPASREVAVVVEGALAGREGQVIADSGRGLSRARNAAVAASSGELITMLDDDCEAAPDWLERLVARAQANPRIGILSGTVVAPPKGRRGFGNCPSCAPADVIYETAVRGHAPPPGFECIGANFAFTRAAADAIGPFDELLGAGAHFPVAEDMDFQWRAVELGIVMQGVPEAVVHHTYGWRYGLKALWHHQQSYARGNGGYAGKLTLLRDPWGAWVLADHRRMIMRDLRQRRNPAALPIALRRYALYRRAYLECLTEYAVDDRALLRRRDPQVSPQHAGAVTAPAYTMTGAVSPQAAAGAVIAEVAGR